MNTYPAVKTINRINESLEKDNGRKWKDKLKEILPEISDIYSVNDTPRDYLGASIIGEKCNRKLWYSFRNYKDQELDSRMIRLFNRGHMEEGRFVALLDTAKMEITIMDENKKQIGFLIPEIAFGGSCDGVVKNCPDIPDGELAICEFKTHGDKSFREMLKIGIRSKMTHYYQMQTYMGKLGYNYGLYLAVNKNNDELFGLIVEFDEECYLRLIEKAKEITLSIDPPSRISNNQGWFDCVYCQFKGICHNGETPKKHCKSCRFSNFLNGKWNCTRWECDIPEHILPVGCESHEGH